MNSPRQTALAAFWSVAVAAVLRVGAADSSVVFIVAAVVGVHCGDKGSAVAGSTMSPAIVSTPGSSEPVIVREFATTA